MNKHLIRATLGLIGLMGTLAIGIVNAAETRVIPGTQEISYTLNGDEEHPFTAKTLTITDCDAENPTEDCTTITILDRNLGATAVGTGCEDSTRGTECMNGTEDETYGYHFQWGNNHGFKPNFNNDDSFPGNEEAKNYDVANVDASSYGPGNYYSGSTFITDSSWSNNGDWSTVRNDGLWGGSLTESTDGAGGEVDVWSNEYLNGEGWKVTNVTNRQGPCPEGFHVPSVGELAKLTKMFGLDDSLSNYKEVLKGMHTGLNMPFAGFRNYGDASVYNLGSNANLWSSSPNSASNPNSRYLNLGVDGDLNMVDYNRAYALSVRCFYDSYQPYAQSFTLTLHANSGEVTTGTLETDDEGKVTLPNAIRNADENGERVFEGWFAGEGVSEKIGNSGDVITLTGDMDVYAHWAQTITIWNPTDPSKGFTIMDRNLGATTNEISSTGSYGFHYQRGNNYGFLNSITTGVNPGYFSQDRAIYDGYGPDKPYNNPVFRWGDTDYWDTSNDHYDNLWGGTGDPNNEWDSGNDRSERQGPCPADYHVPSQKEWNDLLVLYRSILYTGTITYEHSDEGGTYYEGDTFGDDFAAYFKLPFAGRRTFSVASLDSHGSDGYYWSSSPRSASSNYARYLYLYSSYVRADRSGYRASGLSVRCFKDSYEAPTTYTLTFDSQGGDEVATGVAVENTSRSRPENPSKSGYVFVDWYTSTGYESAFDFTGTLATGNLTVYAKWDKDCGDGVYFEEMDVCATRDADNIVYYWTGSDGKGLISIISGDIILTMLDKNEGASVAGTGTDSYGELYQRGNNAPIKSATAVENERAEYENYGPGHSFYDENFRYGSSMYDYWQDDIHYNNLWGGSGDDTALDWGGINNGDTRQGPCDTGYHVPSIMEWESVLQMFASSVGQNLNGSTLHYFSNSTNVGKFRNAFLLPLVGYRDYYNASLYYQGSNGNYWSSSPYGSDYPNSARRLYLNSSNVNASSSYYRTYGYSVRCFKDSYVAPISYTLEFDANGGELSGADSEGKLLQKVESGKKAQQPQGISKDGAVFQNWVYSGDESTVFDFSASVTSNAQLKAEWSTLYTLTIHYVNSKGVEVFPDYTGSYISGAEYSVVSQTKEHYNVSPATVSGVMPNENHEETVTYSTETEDTNDNGIADEDEDHFTLTIHYVNSKGGTVFEDYTGSYVSGASYNIASTEKEHYTIDKATISGVMGNADVEETVTYSTQTEDTNDNGIADEDEDHFTLEFTGGENGTLSGQTIWPDVLTGLTFDEAGIIIPEVIPNSGYMFSGWNPEITGGTIVTEGITLTPIYGEDKNGNGKNDENEEHFTLEFTGGENGILSGQTKWEDVLTGVTFDEAGIIIPEVIPNSGYVFGGWSPKTPTSGDIVSTNYSVIWKVDTNNNGIADEDEPSSGGGSSGGGGSSKKPSDSGKTTEGGKGNNVDNDKNTENVIQSETKGSEESSNTPMDSSANASEGQTYTQEFQEAYEFAKENGITTMPTIQNADMNGKLTRIAMAKMLSYYAINVLGMKPDETRINKFNDITEKLDAQYDSGVTLAYQLGIMGINMPNNNFRPNDVVTRAEFATALSRMLYSTPDGKPYYITHLLKLKAEGILKNDDYKMKELRGYVMIMLMRSAK